ncbi:MAG: endolytic transglycosylase MltG [Gammaproteobacteria bacterium AqS3]|nr:endolytic transglycosylase MltG [Gammaproteobacteria bacterium AqS3]
MPAWFSGGPPVDGVDGARGSTSALGRVLDWGASALPGLVLCALFVLSLIAGRLTAPLGVDFREFEVHPGEGLSSVLIRLGEDGPRGLLIKAYARLADLDPLVRGRYRIQPRDTAFDLLDRLIRGDQIFYRFTVPEGLRARDFIDILQRADHIAVTLRGESPEDIARRLGIEHLEGWLAPDTYVYSAGTSDIDILRLALRQQREILERLWAGRADGLPLKTPYEALTLASIVEKESAVQSERAEIAGVFVRRLQRRMRLQSDPTVIYGLGDAYKNNITRRHLDARTPYNTYTISGLPPTPIALPGLHAIEAVMHPAEGETLYFVAIGDDSGRHRFSVTYAEHRAAVREMLRLQKRRRSKKNSR